MKIDNSQKTQLASVSIYKSVFGTILFILKGQPRLQTAPDVVGPYRLVSPVNKKLIPGIFGVGIYEGDGETGILVPHGDVAQFADKISLILQTESLRNPLSWNAIVWARNFEWQKSSEKFIRIVSSRERSKSHSEMSVAQRI